MNEKRQGEIALKMVKQLFLEKGLIDKHLHRKIGTMAKDLAIEKDEAESFIHSILPEIIAEALKLDSVSLDLSK